MLRDVMGQVVRLRGRWRVVGSTRKFDLRCSADWQEVFRGRPVSDDFVDSEFRHVRHLNVPRLDQAELTQVAEQSPELGAYSKGPETSLFELLRQPFNLRLGAALLSDGVALADLTPLRTQIELLDRYWERRVLGADAGRLGRQSLVRSVCEEMVRRQALRVPVSRIASHGHHEAIHQLMSQGVLSQAVSPRGPRSASDSIAFSHHVLFDYAVARTLLRDEPDDLARRLSQTPGLVLLIRPSLSLHFQHLWLDDAERVSFWREALGLLRVGGVPRVGQLVGPEVAANSARSLEDLRPLMEGLQDHNSGRREAAEKAVEHVVGAPLASGLALVGDNGGPWADWAEQLSSGLTRRTGPRTCPTRVLDGQVPLDDRGPEEGDRGGGALPPLVRRT